MSVWGGIYAEFSGGTRPGDLFAADLRREIEEHGELAPVGSESGPGVYRVGPTVYVEGRLRDVSDMVDSPLVLAWFAKHAQWVPKATLLWEIDGGPRYRYEWSDGELTRLRGVLE